MKSKNLLRPINAENNVYVKIDSIPETFADEADEYEYVFHFFSDISFLRWSGNLLCSMDLNLDMKKQSI